MTVPEFFASTTLTDTQIAEHCGVHLSQIGRWREGRLPRGNAAVKLFQLSGNRLEFPKRKRRRKSKSAA